MDWRKAVLIMLLAMVTCFIGAGCGPNARGPETDAAPAEAIDVPDARDYPASWRTWAEY